MADPDLWPDAATLEAGDEDEARAEPKPFRSPAIEHALKNWYGRRFLQCENQRPHARHLWANADAECPGVLTPGGIQFL